MQPCKFGPVYCLDSAVSFVSQIHRQSKKRSIKILVHHDGDEKLTFETRTKFPVRFCSLCMLQRIRGRVFSGVFLFGDVE